MGGGGRLGIIWANMLKDFVVNWALGYLYMYFVQSSRNLLSSCWTAVRKSENFCWTEKWMPDKNNRVLLYLNKGPSKFSKNANLMENSQNTQKICAIFISHPKYSLGIFLDYNFSSDILSGKLTKFAEHFRNLPVLSDRPMVFAKTVFRLWYFSPITLKTQKWSVFLICIH